MDEPLLTDLIAPIEGERSVGQDVRTGAASELYLSVKDERAAARVAEREALSSGDPDVDPLLAGLRAWTVVASGGAELIAHHAKDLQVAAWLVEAWVRTDGLAGLADGLTLLAELVEQYWDEGLHPADDEDVEGRLAPLFGLFGRSEPGSLLQPIKLLPLTDRPGETVALWAVERVRAQSVRHDNPDTREEMAARRTQRLAAFEAAIAGASPSFLADSLDAIARALTELDRLMAAVDAKTGQGRFGSQVAAPLTAIADLLRPHSRAPAAVESPATEVGGDLAGEVVLPMASAVAAPSKPKELDRAGALATLLDMAGFFDRTEPQSLIGQGLREVVRRAQLPLDDLIAELLPDRDQRAMFMLRAGIKSAPANDGGNGYTTF